LAISYILASGVATPSHQCCGQPHNGSTLGRHVDESHSQTSSSFRRDAVLWSSSASVGYAHVCGVVDFSIWSSRQSPCVPSPLLIQRAPSANISRTALVRGALSETAKPNASKLGNREANYKIIWRPRLGESSGFTTRTHLDVCGLPQHHAHSCGLSAPTLPSYDPSQAPPVAHSLPPRPP
jgi:hypothetical protein